MPKEHKGLGAASLSLICLVISGMGIGWLLGLSVSPVLHIIVASVIALVMGIVGALAGLDINPGSERNDSESNELKISPREKLVKISPFPMTALIAGLVIGACFGVYARANELLGANPQRLVQRWNGVNGLDDAGIKRRLFDHLYPPTSYDGVSNGELLKLRDQNQSEESLPTPSAGNSTKTKPVGNIKADKPPGPQLSVTSHAGTLFSLSVQECGFLRLQDGENLRTRLKALNKSYINSFLAKCESDQCIEALKEMLCSVKD